MSGEAISYQQGQVECCDLIFRQSKTACNIGIAASFQASCCLFLLERSKSSTKIHYYTVEHMVGISRNN